MSAVTFSKATKLIWISVHGVSHHYHLELRQNLKEIPGYEGEDTANSTISLCYSSNKTSEDTLLRIVRQALSKYKQAERQLRCSVEWIFWAMIDAVRPDPQTEVKIVLELTDIGFISEAAWVAQKRHANAVRLVLTAEPDKSRRQQIATILTKHLNL